MIASFWVYSQERIFVIDSSESQINFKISHLGAFKVKGVFSNHSGKIVTNGNNLKFIESVISVKSINTANQERDDILETEPYFNCEEFPFITFIADDFQMDNQINFINGKLKIKGTESLLSFPYEVEFDNELNVLRLTASTRIKRKDYNLIFGSMNGLIGNKVDIQLEIVAKN